MLLAPPSRSPRLSVLAFVVLVTLGLGACSTLPGGFVAFQPDEQSIELALRDALDEEGLRYSVDRVRDDNDDVYLTLMWADKEVPEFRTVIDTFPTREGGDERAVGVYLYTDQRIPAEGRAATVELLNQVNADYWFGDLYLSEDGAIRGLWAINVDKSGGLTAFSVVSMVKKYADMWFSVYPSFAECAACGLHAKGEEPAPKAAPLEGAGRAL